MAGVANGFTQKMHDERKAMEIERDLLQGKSSGVHGASPSEASLSRLCKPTESVTASGVQEERSAQHGRGSTKFAVVTGSQSALQAGYDAGRSLSLNRALSGSQHKGLPGS